MHEALEEFKAGILGPLSLGTYMLLFFFSSAAIVLSIYAHYQNKGKENPMTPTKFSWAYAIFENVKRIVAGLLMMYLIFRFATSFISPEILKGDKFLLAAIGLGFTASYGLDKLIQYIQTKTAIKLFDMPNPYVDTKKQIIETIVETTEQNTDKPEIKN